MKMKRILAAVLLAALLLVNAAPALALSSGDLVRVSTKAKWVALRAGAGTSSKRLAKLANGTLAVYDGKAKNGFVRVRVGKTYGYIAKKYIKGQNRALKTRDVIPLQKAASDSAERYVKLAKGLKVIALSDAGGEWLLIACDGYQGYVKYSQLRAASMSDGKKIYAHTDGSTPTVMYKQPNTSAEKVGSIPENAIAVSFGLVKSGSGWLYVNYKDKYGFIKPDVWGFR